MSSEGADPEATDPLIGTVVADRYEILERLGEGGVGVVYKARQEPIGQLVALKVLLPGASSDADRASSRFLNEARIIAQLRHPNTVKLIDFGHTADARLFMAMEYLSGGTVADLLAGGRLPWRAALRITRQVALALAEAHAAGIIHRDLKPENVLLDEVHGETHVVRVCDFGIAKFKPLGDVVLTAPGTRLGTPAYMSPEQAFARPVDHRTDLYALGVLLYEMLTGEPPFDAEESAGLYLAHLHDAPQGFDGREGLAVPAEVERLVMQLLAKDPAARPPTADAVVARVDRALRHEQEGLGEEETAVVLPAAPAAAAEEDADEDAGPFAVARAHRRGLSIGLGIGALVAVAVALLLAL